MLLFSVFLFSVVGVGRTGAADGKVDKVTESDLLDGKSAVKSTNKCKRDPTRAPDVARGKFLYLHSSSKIPEKSRNIPRKPSPIQLPASQGRLGRLRLPGEGGPWPLAAALRLRTDRAAQGGLRGGRAALGPAVIVEGRVF